MIGDIREKAKKLRRHIVLPDALDPRTLQAARVIVDDAIASVSLIGDEKEIRKKAEEASADLGGVTIADPAFSSSFGEYADILYELRKHKGLNQTEAVALMKNPLYFGAMMVRTGAADGSVAGSLSTTADVLRAAIHVIGTAEGISVVSSFFLIVFPNAVYTFADGAVVPDPSPDQLADIALASAENHRKLTGQTPCVAMLSFSTKGSADHPLVDRVREATAIAQKKNPGLAIDGELQLDTAIIPSVAKRKAPDSAVAGRANVLIFPNLDAGNIGYKMAQRMGGAEALGPIVQGLHRPAFDLSRGASVDDIVSVVAINAVLGSP